MKFHLVLLIITSHILKLDYLIIMNLMMVILQLSDIERLE
jgi:hypothetical protein